MDALTRIGVVADFHDVKEKAFGVVPSNMQDVNEPRVRAGDGHKLLDASEFAFVRGVLRKIASPDNFHGVKNTDGVARQPNLAIGAFADPAHERVIRDDQAGFLCLCLRPTLSLDQRAFEHVLFELHTMKMTAH